MKITLIIKTLFLASMMLGFSIQAQTFKWVDEKGITHYGDSIPPEYRDRSNVEMSKRGIPVKKNAAAPTPEERKVLEEEERKQKEAKYKLAEQKRKDLALINTYTSEQEIDITKDRNIRQIEVRIKSAQERINEIRARITQQQKALPAASQNPALMQDLNRSISDNEKKINDIEVSIVQYKVEIDMLSARYESEKARFRELSQPKQPAQPQHKIKTDSKVAVDESLIRTSVKH